MRSVPTRQSFSKMVHQMSYTEQFESAKMQRASQPPQPVAPIKPKKHDAPMHLICLHCGAEGHSTSLGNRLLVWLFADSSKPHQLPLEVFDRQVGCGKCGSHKLEGINSMLGWILRGEYHHSRFN